MDVRLLDTPMQELSCGECAAQVLVRKATWQQTSIQWDSQAQSACREYAAFRAEGNPADQFRRCDSLTESINEASTVGIIEIVHVDAPQE